MLNSSPTFTDPCTTLSPQHFCNIPKVTGIVTHCLMLMLYMCLIDHQGNVNQTQNETPLHTQQDDNNKKDMIMSAGDCIRVDPASPAGGNGKWYNHSGKQTCNASVKVTI